MRHSRAQYAHDAISKYAASFSIQPGEPTLMWATCYDFPLAY